MAPNRFPPRFAHGLRHFNAGRFFEAHEVFEELLDEVEGDQRWDCLVALIQVAVGYHKCAAGHPGAERMLRLGGEKLARCPAVIAGLDVGRLRVRVRDDLATLEADASLAARLGEAPPRLEMRRAPEAATPRPLPPSPTRSR